MATCQCVARFSVTRELLNKAQRCFLYFASTQELPASIVCKNALQQGCSSERFIKPFSRSFHSHGESTHLAIPPPADREKEKRQQERTDYIQTTALQRIRACCTLDELWEVSTTLASSPVLVVQAAVQAPRVAQWPLASERHVLRNLMGNLVAQCAMHMERYDVRQLASLVGACVRAHYAPEALLLPLELRLAADARRGHLKDAAADVAALATNLSRLRAKPARLWTAVGESALACLAQATHADVTALLAAHARAEAANRKLFDRAVARVTIDMRDAHPQDVATLMWALARSGHGCSRSLVRSLNLHLTGRAPEFGVLQLATVAGACAKMKVGDAELRRRLSERAVEAMLDEAAALQSSGSLASQLLQQYGTGKKAPAAQPLTSRAVVVLVTGLCSMGPADPGLLQAAAALLGAMAAHAGAGGTAAVRPDAADVEQVAPALRQAGLEREHAELVEACGPARPLESE